MRLTGKDIVMDVLVMASSRIRCALIVDAPSIGVRMGIVTVAIVIITVAVTIGATDRKA